MQMSKKQNVERDLSVDLTRSFTHVIENRLNQKDTYTTEEVLFFALNDNSVRYTESHIQSKSETEENTTSRDVESHNQANLEQDLEKRRHNQ